MSFSKTFLAKQSGLHAMSEKLQQLSSWIAAIASNMPLKAKDEEVNVHVELMC